MSISIVDLFRNLIPSDAKITSRGFYTFNCPFCGDKRGRGKFFFTDTGGIRFSCFNGGCPWEKATGWEPENGLVGRPKRLFLELGGNAFDIPDEYRKYKNNNEVHEVDWKLWAEGHYDIQPKLEVATHFDEIPLPDHSEILWDATSTYAKNARTYVLQQRSPVFRKYPLLWSPAYKRYVIIPFLYKEKIIGWIARRVDEHQGLVHIKCSKFPTDYMYNQELLFDRERKIVLIQEGTFDALAFDTLCTFGSTISKKQINLLNSSRKEIVLLPDYKKNEWNFYLQTAKENNWSLSCPVYPGTSVINKTDHIKDAGDSLTKNGLLLTTEVIMEAITKDYEYAKMIYTINSR